MKNQEHRSSFILAVLTVATGLSCRDASYIHPSRKDLVETVYASGKILSEHEYEVPASCTGTILRKYIKDGDTVRKGQILYVVDSKDVKVREQTALDNYRITEFNLSDRSPLLNDLALALQNAEIRRRNDSLTYFRWEALWAENIGTRSNLDNSLVNYQLSLNAEKIARQKYQSALNDIRVSRNNAYSQLTGVRQSLEDYFIRSDRNGVVYQTFKESGEGVRNNEVVALLGEHNRLLIQLAVDQQDIARIKPGQQVLVQADATGNRIYEASVSKIYPVMNELDQTFRVEAVFTGSGTPSFIHSSVEANIVIRKKADVLVLPRTAILNGDSVWVREKGKDKKIQVEAGLTTLDYIEILSGIQEGTAVRVDVKTDQP